MKKIMIVEKELTNLNQDNKRIIFKKNKTIIKDKKYLDDIEFIDKLKKERIKFKQFLEEWEVRNEDRIQLLCANDGSPLRAVHIISDLHPNGGVKALFQSEKIIILKISLGNFELSKNYINEAGEICSNVLKTGKFLNLSDIREQISENFHPMLNSLIRNYEKFNEEGYLSPFYAAI